jgi:hypothetical protein
MGENRTTLRTEYSIRQAKVPEGHGLVNCRLTLIICNPIHYDGPGLASSHNFNAAGVKWVENQGVTRIPSPRPNEVYTLSAPDTGLDKILSTSSSQVFSFLFMSISCKIIADHPGICDIDTHRNYLIAPGCTGFALVCSGALGAWEQLPSADAC